MKVPCAQEPRVLIIPRYRNTIRDEDLSGAHLMLAGLAYKTKDFFSDHDDNLGTGGEPRNNIAWN